MSDFLKELLNGIKIPAAIAIGFALGVGVCGYKLGDKVATFESRIKNLEDKYTEVEKYRDAINENLDDIRALAQHAKFQLPSPGHFVNRKMSSPGDPLYADEHIGRELAGDRSMASVAERVFKEGLEVKTDAKGRVLIVPPAGRVLTYSRADDGTLVIDLK